MNLKINFELQPQDYADFVKYQFVKRKLKNTILLYAFILVGVLWFINKNQFNLILSIITLVYFTIAFVFGTLRSLKKKKSLKDENELLGLLNYEFTDDGFTCESNQSKSYSKWSVVKNIQESSSAFYLVCGANTAILVPKRCFSTPDQATEFKQYIEAKIINS
jgi:Ca2+/Na+ antiporter